MSFVVRKATKAQTKLRLALIGPSGSGKTYSALSIATALAKPGERVRAIDTEHGSASKYAGIFDFDVLELDSFAPDTYVEALEFLGRGGPIVVDSLSHAWMGKDGALEQKDRAAKASRSGNDWTAWRDITPMHNRLVEALIACPSHLIVTIRSKTEYVQEKDEKGKTVIRKVGMAPIQRDGLEYEFDVVGDMNLENELVVSKSRCPEMTRQVYHRPGAKVAAILSAWLSDGVAPVAGELHAQRPATEPPPAEHRAPEHRERKAAEELLFSSLMRGIESATDIFHIAEARDALKAAKLQLSLDHFNELVAAGKARKEAIQAKEREDAIAAVQAKADAAIEAMGDLPTYLGGTATPDPDPHVPPEPPEDVKTTDFASGGMSALGKLHLERIMGAATLVAYRKAMSAFQLAATGLSQAEAEQIWAVGWELEKNFATTPEKA